MWKSHLQTEQLTIEADTVNKQILMRVHTHEANPIRLHLEETDCTALLYTLLTINREFHHDKNQPSV